MTRRRLLSPVLPRAVGLMLAGCTPPAAEPNAWQGVVQTLASQASAGDYSSASATLDQLEADVIAQRDAGTIASAEAEAILSRIATVRADLASLAPSPEPTPEQTTEPVTEDTSEPTPSTVSDDGATDDEQKEPAGPGEKDSEKSGKGDSGKGKSDAPAAPGGPGKKDG